MKAGVFQHARKKAEEGEERRKREEEEEEEEKENQKQNISKKPDKAEGDVVIPPTQTGEKSWRS